MKTLEYAGAKFNVYHWRLINKRNFNPMTHNLIDWGLLADCMQIYTDVIGGRAWVTVEVER